MTHADWPDIMIAGAHAVDHVAPYLFAGFAFGWVMTEFKNQTLRLEALKQHVIHVDEHIARARQDAIAVAKADARVDNEALAKRALEYEQTTTRLANLRGQLAEIKAKIDRVAEIASRPPALNLNEGGNYEQN